MTAPETPNPQTNDAPSDAPQTPVAPHARPLPTDGMPSPHRFSESHHTPKCGNCGRFVNLSDPRVTWDGAGGERGGQTVTWQASCPNCPPAVLR